MPLYYYHIYYCMAITQHKGPDTTEELAQLVTIRQKMLFSLCESEHMIVFTVHSNYERSRT